MCRSPHRGPQLWRQIEYKGAVSPGVERVFREPASSIALRNLAALVVVALVVLAGAQVGVYGRPIFPVDDAYITLHNALSLRAGSDANYVGVPALVGATSSVHVVVVSALLWLGDIWALWLAGWLAVIAYALGVIRLAKAFEASAPVALGLVVLSLLIGKTPHQLCNGLETGLAMAGVTWSLAWASEPEGWRNPRLMVLLGLLPFLRPELAAFSGLTVAQAGLAAFRAREDRTVWRTFARGLAFVVLGAAPWMLLYWRTTGLPFPNTVQAKRLFFAEGCAPFAVKWGTTHDMLTLFAETLGYASRAAILLVLTRMGRVGLIFAGTVFVAYYVNLPGALGHYEQRYLYVLVPFVLLGIASAVRHSSRIARFAGVALLIVGLDESAWHFSERWREHLATIRFTKDELATVATWSREHLAPDASLLIHDAGYMSWATRLKLFDIVGLKTPSSIPVHRELTWRACVDAPRDLDVGAMSERVNRARAEAIARIAEQDRPTHLVVLRYWEDIYGVVGRMRALGWKLERLREAPRGYEVFSLEAPAAGAPRP